MKKITMFCAIFALSSQAAKVTTLQTKDASDSKVSRMCILKSRAYCSGQVFEATDDFPREFLDRSNFSKSVFNGTKKDWLDMRGVDIHGANFSNVEMNYVVAGGAHMRGANFSGATIKNSHFDDILAQQSKFVGATIEKTTFDHSFFSGANFSGVKLEKVDIHHSTLESANFSNSTIKGMDATGVQAHRADFSNSEISADFTGADLREANFKCTVFGRGTKFTDADLTRAHFDGANLKGVDMSEADERLVAAHYCHTIDPEGNMQNGPACKAVKVPDCMLQVSTTVSSN
jgi:uncharacterized protein YjbI with pentapeptide repeats